MSVSAAPLRILHTNMLRGWGGQSNRILSESLAVMRHAPECHLALAVPRGCELARRAREAGIKAVHDDFAFRGPGHPVTFFRDVARMRALLRAESWDILHLHGSPDSWTALFALRAPLLGQSGGAGRPVVIRTRHNVFPIAAHPLNAWLYGRAIDGLIVISRAAEEQCRSISFLRKKPIARIPDVVDLARFHPAADPVETRRRVRAALDTPEDAPVVLFAGRMRPEKAPDQLLRALPALRRMVPGARVWLAGDGSHRAQYERLARELGVMDEGVNGSKGEKACNNANSGNNVEGGCAQFLGFRTDVPDLMAAADVSCVPSRSEGLGTAALEALACELPVVAARVGGLADAVEHGETGLLVDAADAGALARALAELLGDPERRRRMGAAGRRHILEGQFTEDSLARSTISFYTRLLGEANVFRVANKP